MLITQRLDSALTIPQSATYELQDKVFAYCIEHGKAKATRLEVTPLNEEKLYIVHSGQSTGEQIVSEGVGLLQDGAEITIR